MDQRATTVEPMPQVWRIQVMNLPVALPDRVHAAIDRHWTSVTAAGRPYWNGPALAIAHETKSDSRWRVELHRTDYAHYLATLHRQIAATYWCRVVAVGDFSSRLMAKRCWAKMRRQPSMPGNSTASAGESKWATLTRAASLIPNVAWPQNCGRRPGSPWTRVPWATGSSDGW